MKRLPHTLIVQSDKATRKGRLSLEYFKALFEEENQFFSVKFPGKFSDFGSKELHVLIKRSK